MKGVTPGMAAALKLLVEHGAVRVNPRHPDPARREIAAQTSHSLRSRRWTLRIDVPGQSRPLYVLTQSGANVAAALATELDPSTAVAS